MIIRPTADPHTITLSLAVFGQRGGHMHARFTARYVAMHRGQDVAVEARVTPSSMRQRRHLAEGVMVTCPLDQQRMICDFLSWWPGDWQADCYRFRSGSELDFLREGVPLLRDNSVQVSVEEGLRDIVSEDPMRLRLDVQVKGPWFFLGIEPSVGDQVVSGAALKAAASLGRTWVSVGGKAVNIPEEVDLALLAEASDGVQAVPRTQRDKVIGALSLMRGCSIEADRAELLKSVMYSPSEDELPKSMNAKLMDYQVVGHKWLKEKLSIGTGGVLADDMGLGKEQPVDTPVATPTGWRPIGSLKVGDQVIGVDGRPTTVTGVFPQGVKPVFRVTFNDGSSTMCGLEHLWAVREECPEAGWMVKSTKELMDSGLVRPSGSRLAIPTVAPVEYEEREFPEHPFDVGRKAASLGSAVPPEYLLGSRDQRSKLLLGLMFEGGFRPSLGTWFHSGSGELAFQVIELVQSLGGWARHSFLIGHDVLIKLPGFVFFTKRADTVVSQESYDGSPDRLFECIEPAGDAECVCIAVDAPDHLYVTENYIVTHNTLQTISAILAAIEFKPDYKVLVAAPTSLLFNWAAEIEKFAPSIASDVLFWEGKDRKSYRDYLPKSRVVLVSYPTLRRDVAILGDIRFDLGVFDEAQNLKNADTASHKAVVSLQCATRIALSGTPIENRLSDLHAIFSVACPGLLPPYEEFEERYAKPLREGRPEGLELMKHHVQPHILRRRKEDVLKDLPEKMINDHYCEMTPKQAERYAEALAESRLERDNAPDASARAAVMLKVLTRLRQIAADPRLGDRTGQYRAEDSGKIQSLRTLMDLIDADDTNKVLIFSQWVESLELIRMEMEKRGQKYSYLTGATSDRDIQCKQFQERREFRYFLISLHAGGVGLNLTAANYVINMDPWWNPAKEAQAFARAHRHGQTRPVTVYRMIAPGTIEDKIASMQEFKQALADGIIDDGALPQLSVRDMSALID